MKIETYECLHRLDRRGNILLRSLKQSISKLHKLQGEIRKIISDTSEIGTDENEQHAVDTAMKIDAVVGGMANEIKRYFRNVSYFPPAPVKEQMQDTISRSVRRTRKELGISATFKDGVLILRTLHPINRYSKKTVGSPYDMEIEDALCEALQSGDIRGPTTFFFWHIYSKDKSKNVVNYPDNDNYLTKSIIDLICSRFGLSDMGTEAYLFHATKLDDDIPSATYVMVAQRSGYCEPLTSFDYVKQMLLSLQL